MAIRIRNINGYIVALCAAETNAKENDLYLDDGIHHALTTKFILDFKSEGYNCGGHDPLLEKLMKSHKIRDAKEELEKWLDGLK